MLPAEDRLAFCRALQRLSRFTPAELAMNAQRRLRSAREFLHDAPALVKVVAPKGHDPRRPAREVWAVVGERWTLSREIDQLTAESRVPAPVGDLFTGIDRLLRDVADGERALMDCKISEAALHAERQHLAAQRAGIEHALVDVEVRISAAVRSRRQINRLDTSRVTRHTDGTDALRGLEAPFGTMGSTLVDWSRPSSSRPRDRPAGAASPELEQRLAEELVRLASSPDVDAHAVSRAVASLRALRAIWTGPQDFGGALDVEFRHLLRQPYAGRLRGPLAMVAVLMAEAACARSLFEGWVMEQASSEATASCFPLLPAALARLAFETHMSAGTGWPANRAAEMCGYVLSTSSSPLGTVLSAAGSLLSQAPDLERVLPLIAMAYEQVFDSVSDAFSDSITRTICLALFLQTGRPESVEEIDSIPDLPGGVRLFNAMLDRRHDAVVCRLDRYRQPDSSIGERYDLVPGRAIKALLAERLGAGVVGLSMPVSDDFERRRAIDTAASRWTVSPAPADSFLGELEASGRTH